MNDTAGKPRARCVTPSQTVGPFFAFCLTPRAYRRDDLVTNDLAGADTEGERIAIEGVVRDGNAAPVVDAMLEIWQADAFGRYVTADSATAAAFRGFGRAESDRDGRYTLTTIKPGAVPAANGPAQAPHINVSIFAKGLQRQLFTRIYFADEPSNASDPVLACVPAALTGTLLARPIPGRPAHYRFDIRLRGEDETVFFEA